MAYRLGIWTIAAILGMNACLMGQQGLQGPDQRRLGDSVSSIERAISTYLNGDEIKSVLSPGEYCEWPLTLKAGQVVIAEARSDAFDPAIEIVDDKGKPIAQNDDRYPGDQRPLILWRCDHDGTFGLHVRCFHDRSGGQFFVRFKTYDTVDLSTRQQADQEIDTDKPFLLRIPMKAGELKEIIRDAKPDRARFRFGGIISPIGLPEQIPSLTQPIGAAIRALMAPVAGDYYSLEIPFGTDRPRGTIHVETHDVVPVPPTKQGEILTGKANTNIPSIWEISVKKGDLFEATASGLNLNCRFVLSEAPNIDQYDLTDSKKNPFFPKTQEQLAPKESPFSVLPARARDGRQIVFCAKRDAKLWLASNGDGPSGKEYALTLKPAAEPFAEEKPEIGNLRIGKTDYWAFDAKAGDVLALNSTATSFTQDIAVWDPDLGVIRDNVVEPDQTSDSWQMIVHNPGRYLVAVSCFGAGGGGAYQLSRKVFHAKEFGKTSSASGEIGNGETQIWKFTVKPEDPLLVHWKSSNWDYDVAIYDDKGEATDFQRQDLDKENRVGILKVDQAQTYVIVLTGKKAKACYSITLGAIPGYRASSR